MSRRPPIHVLPNTPTLRQTRGLSTSTAAKAAPGKPKGEEETPQKSIVERVVDFAKTQSSRPDFDRSDAPIEVTKHPDPEWKYGQGVRWGQRHRPDDPVTAAEHREVDPLAPGRSMVDNYRLLISGIAPRPIGFLSTVSGGPGPVKKNLAPFSYFQVVEHDPPTFVVGFSARAGREKDTYRNLRENGECVINTVSENMIEAVNAASIDAPYGVSEWDVSGLTEAPASTVRPSRVRESVFSVEGRVVDIKEFNSPAASKPTMSVAAVVLIQATRFWVREDATNAAASHIDLEKLRPVAQLGGIAYGRIASTFELPRQHWDSECRESELLSELDRQSKKSEEETAGERPPE
ncbi:hypothetical protein SLS62_010434 [Diatrype stigma]|uniref:Flavin reductase like domain-containing protein n=1 Tax=Diatrype stigma TaxID=117547 RepID=A0AAN9UBS5_9PEZI